jgi:ABC-type uncharacterized transport system substrate-binding protein
LLGVTLVILEVQSPADFDGAFGSAGERGAGALIILSSPIFSATGATGPKLAELALLHRLPAVSLFPDFARAGGLVAYGPNLLDIFRQAGVIVAKVLKVACAGMTAVSGAASSYPRNSRRPAPLSVARPHQFLPVFTAKYSPKSGTFR